MADAATKGQGIERADPANLDVEMAVVSLMVGPFTGLLN